MAARRLGQVGGATVLLARVQVGARVRLDDVGLACQVERGGEAAQPPVHAHEPVAVLIGGHEVVNVGGLQQPQQLQVPALRLGQDAHEVAVVDAVDGAVAAGLLGQLPEVLDGVGGHLVLAAVVVDDPLLLLRIAEGARVASRRGSTPGTSAVSSFACGSPQAARSFASVPYWPRRYTRKALRHGRAGVGVLLGPTAEVVPLGVDAIAGVPADDALAPRLRAHVLDERGPGVARVLQPPAEAGEGRSTRSASSVLSIWSEVA